MENKKVGDTWGMTFEVDFWTSRTCTHLNTGTHMNTHMHTTIVGPGSVLELLPLFFLLNYWYIIFSPGNGPLLYNFHTTDSLFLHIVYTNLCVCGVLFQVEVLHWGDICQGPSILNGFVCSRIGARGLEILDRKKQRYKRKRQRHRRESGGIPVNTEFPVFIFHMLYIPHIGGK